MATWWGDYAEARLIRAGAAFDTLSAVDAQGRPRVLVVPAAGTPAAYAREVLDDLRRAHAAIDHPWIPRATATTSVGGVDLVELEGDACIDMPGAMRRMIEAGRRVPYAQADALFTGVRMAMQAAHAAGLCLGRLTPANLLFGRGGDVRLVGFGRNFALEAGPGALDVSLPCFQAPEVAAGGRPTPTGDYVALLQLVRAHLHLAELVPVLERLLRGEESELERQVLRALRWFEDRVLGSPGPRRPTIEQAARRSAMLRRILGTEVDFDGLRAWTAELLAGYEPPAVAADAVGLEIGPAAAWFALDGGDRRDLETSPTTRRLLFALARRRLEAPGRAMTAWELAEVLWPGERMDPLSALRRVYSAVDRLCRLGLAGLVEHVGGGYRLSPACRLRVEAP
jgi:hypothetical protein